MTSKATNASGLSAREVDVLCAMCQSLKSKPEVCQTSHSPLPSLQYSKHPLTRRNKTDMEKFATLAGFTTKASAKSNLYKVLKKVLPKDAAASPEGEKKVGGRKRKAGE